MNPPRDSTCTVPTGHETVGLLSSGATNTLAEPFPAHTSKHTDKVQPTIKLFKGAVNIKCDANESKRKPSNNLAFHRSTVLKRMCYTEHAKNVADNL